MTDGWRKLPAIELPSPVLALATAAGTLWAGGFGGVAVSANGHDWSPGGRGLSLGTVTALAAGEGVLFAGGEGGLARSLDSGRTWLSSVLPDRTGIVSDIALSPRFFADGTALAATLDNGVLRSTDSGRTWERSSFGLESDEVLALAWGTGDTLVTATASGLFRSPNAGRAWKVVDATAGVAIVALARLADEEMLAAPARGPLLRSPGGLQHWSPLAGLPPETQTSAVLVVDAKTMLVGTAEQGLLRSTDDGASWQSVSPEPVLAMVAIEQLIYAGTDRGLIRSQDGGSTWQEMPAPPLHDLYRLSTVHGSPLISGRNSPPVVLDSSGTWLVLQNAPLPQTGFFVLPGGSFMAGTEEGLFRSDDAGSTWSPVVTGDAVGVTMMTFGDRMQGWAGGGNAGLLGTQDGGRTWDSLPAPFGVLPLVALQALPAWPGRATVLLMAATYDERRHAVTLWRSDDGGEHWVRGADSFTNWPLVATCDEPPAIAIGSTVTIQQADGSWQQAMVGDEGLRRVVGRGRLVMALSGTGLWRSDDAGAIWERSDLELPIEEVLDIALDGDVLYVLLAGGRVWSREL